MEYELSIVMPCLNEVETLGRCIRKAQSWISRAGVDAEIVIGDNGSTDGSIELANQLGAQVVHVRERGYGAALAGAIGASRGRYVIMGDSDDSYDFSDLDAFLQRLREGWDVVMGNRFSGVIEPGAMPWKNRYIGNPVLSALGRTLFSIPIGDFHCGLRGLRRTSFDRLGLATLGMEFASEMVIKAHYHQLRCCEVPIRLAPDGRSRPPHLRPWRDGWRHLRFMMLFAPRWLFLYPGVLVVLSSAAVMALLMLGPRQLGRATFDIHTLLVSGLLLLLGWQSVMFGLMAKVIAIRIDAHPVTPMSQMFERWATVEMVCGIGVVIALIGMASIGITAAAWWASGFGALDPVKVMRRVVPGAMLLAVGMQTVLSGLLLGVIRLPTRSVHVEPQANLA